MATANTFTQIGSTVTVGSGGAATIDFTSIPATYTDLVVLFSGRSSTGGVGGVRININGSAATLSEIQLEGDGATTSSSSASAGYVGYTVGSTDTANVFSNCEIYIPNYASSSNKSWSGDGVSENNGTTAYAGLTAGLRSNTAAITQVTLVVSNSFAQYSTASLYGILKY